MNREYVQFKTFEELKEELGDKFEEYMYKANVELLTKFHRILAYIELEEKKGTLWSVNSTEKVLEILKGDSDE